MKYPALIVILFGFRSLAADNLQMTGFRYVSCNAGANTCVEVTSQKAWMSQLSSGFSTLGVTEVIVADTNGNPRQAITGTDANYDDTLNLLMLHNKQNLVVVSMVTGKTDTFPTTGNRVPGTSALGASVLGTRHSGSKK